MGVPFLTRSQVPSQAQDGPWFLKQRNCGDLRARSQLLALKGIEGCAKALGWNQEEDKLQLLTRTYIKLTNKLVSSHFGAPLVLGQVIGNFRLIRLTMARIQGKPPPSPIQYFLRYSGAPTSEWLFVPGLPRRNPEIVQVWTPGTL